MLLAVASADNPPAVKDSKIEKIYGFALLICLFYAMIVLNIRFKKTKYVNFQFVKLIA